MSHSSISIRGEMAWGGCNHPPPMCVLGWGNSMCGRGLTYCAGPDIYIQPFWEILSQQRDFERLACPPFVTGEHGSLYSSRTVTTATERADFRALAAKRLTHVYAPLYPSIPVFIRLYPSILLYTRLYPPPRLYSTVRSPASLLRRPAVSSLTAKRQLNMF